MPVKTKKAAARFGDDFVSNEIAKKYGDSIKKGTEVLQGIQDKKILGFTPALDICLNGGIREGSTVGIAGPPKTGKTTTVLHFAAKCQKEGRLVVYVNTEGRMNSNNFESAKDLDTEKLIIVESTEEHRLAAEDFLSIVEMYMRQVPSCVIIIDSLSNLVPKHELEGDLNAQGRATLPKLLSQFFKRSSHDVAKNNVILICVAHQIADTGPSQRTRMTDCGNMFQFQVDTNLEITHKSNWEESDKTVVGQVVHWKVLTTNTGGMPQSKAEGWLKYGQGIDEVQEIVSAACEFALIKKAGAWYTIKCLVENTENEEVRTYLKDKSIGSKEEDIEKAFKFQGAKKLCAFLSENPKLLDVIYADLRELLS